MTVNKHPGSQAQTNWPPVGRLTSFKLATHFILRSLILHAVKRCTLPRKLSAGFRAAGIVVYQSVSSSRLRNKLKYGTVTIFVATAIVSRTEEIASLVEDQAAVWKQGRIAQEAVKSTV